MPPGFSASSFIQNAGITAGSRLLVSRFSFANFGPKADFQEDDDTFQTNFCKLIGNVVFEELMI